MIALTEGLIDISLVRAAVVHEQAGAVLIFEGTTRDNFEGKKVVQLCYEAYDDMAIKEMENLKDTLVTEYPMARIAMVHRLGIVGVGETSVAIAVSAPHREEAYIVSRKAIDRLKKTVPIWKKEVYEKGASWKENQ